MDKPVSKGQTYYEIASIYENSKDTDKFLANLEHSVANDEQRFETVHKLGKLYMELENFHDGITFIQKSLQIDPSRIDVLNELANV